MSDETITVHRDGGAGNGETVTVHRGDVPVNGETVTVHRGNQAPAPGETVTVRRGTAPVSGETVTIRRGDAPSAGETVTVGRPVSATGGETVTVARRMAAPAGGETVTVSRPVTSVAGETVTVPRSAASGGQTITVPRGAVANSNGETVTVSRGDVRAASSVLASPFVPEDVTITSHDGQQFIVHLGQVVGHGGQSTVFAAERVDDGLACVAKVFQSLAGKDRDEYEKAVYAVMRLNGRPVSETHLLPIFAYLHQGLSATEVGATAPQLWDIAITPKATCLSDRPRSKHMVKSRVIPELSHAINLLHTEFGIVHRDVKPSNVYLYDKQIALGDYGSARSLSGVDIRKTDTGTQSSGYTPGGGKMVDPRNDWYSFGYTIWTLYEGNVHPLQDLLDHDTFFEFQEAGQPAEFTHPDDATLGNLLQGLTFELANKRFGYEEIKDWIADPDHFYRQLPTFDFKSGHAPYEFVGRLYTDPVSLARGLVSHWDEAKQRMQQWQLERQMRKWNENDLETKIHQITEAKAKGGEKPNYDFNLACVIYEMSGGKIISWRGEDVSLGTGKNDLPARIATMTDTDIDRYAVKSGLDGTASMGVLPSGFLSYVLSRQGEHDEAVANIARNIKAIEDLAASSNDPHFAACLLKGFLTFDELETHAAAQQEIRRLIGNPRAFFATCSTSRAVDEFFLLFAGDVSMDAIIKARGDAQSRGSIDVDVVLDFMDRVADNKAPVRAFYRKYGNMAGWIWLSEHTALYEALPGSAGESAIVNLRGLSPSAQASVASLMQAGSNIRIEGSKLRADMEVTPVPYVNGWQTRDVLLTRPLTLNALFCAEARGEAVPRGYVAELLAGGADEHLLDSIGIRLLAHANLMSSASYSQFLEDERNEADGALEGAIRQDTQDYDVTEGIADATARIEAVKKEQGGVLRWTCIVAVVYFVVILCARGSFGQFIVMCGSFAPLAVLFLVAAFVGIFGFLALNLLRSFSAVDRVQSLDSDLEANADLLESRLAQLVDFDSRTGATAEKLLMVGVDEDLPMAQGADFSFGSEGKAFYADPEVMDRLGRLAIRLLFITAAVISASGFMGTVFIDGDTVAKCEVLLAILVDCFACIAAWGDNEHPSSASTIKSWSYLWLIPAIIAFLLWGVVSLLQSVGAIIAIVVVVLLVLFIFGR
jgi:Protein kinase domain.